MAPVAKIAASLIESIISHTLRTNIIVFATNLTIVIFAEDALASRSREVNSIVIDANLAISDIGPASRAIRMIIRARRTIHRIIYNNGSIAVIAIFARCGILLAPFTVNNGAIRACLII